MDRQVNFSKHSSQELLDCFHTRLVSPPCHYTAACGVLFHVVSNDCVLLPPSQLSYPGTKSQAKTVTHPTSARSALVLGFHWCYFSIPVGIRPCPCVRARGGLWPRNGTNAKQFGAWSGVSAEKAAALVRGHLEAAVQRFPQVSRLLKDVDQPTVIIASCKAMQALRSFGLQQ